MGSISVVARKRAEFLHRTDPREFTNDARMLRSL
jgi:hypothetical protein